MSFHGRVRGTKVKRALGVQAALEWAFRLEQAQLELPLPEDVTEEGFGFGLEYVLLQRAVLGCKIDGGQHKIGGYTHEDAEVIAATVAGIPDSLGGKRMAIRVAELARAGLTPDWMPGAVPRCVPAIVKQNQHGRHRRGHRAHSRAWPGRPCHVEDHRHPRLSGHVLAASAANRGRPARV
jgi:hypothetical protein